MQAQQTGLFQAKPTAPSRPPIIGGGGSNGNSTASGNENISIMPAIIPEPSPANPENRTGGNTYRPDNFTGLFVSMAKETETATKEVAAVLKETSETSEFQRIVAWCKKNWVILTVVALVLYLNRK